ncbi:short-chain dehydrogenase [Diplodia corticola]|uniref:Short-chain dehydrogenase n=1 Tax=Diplodia corticola TaxID=236234 RepID=A0A1J9RQG9_9PEZI|nr:short-chain dehydrogenase [Diplodia corticola]OJD29797.1 short-chain dehydrogenase [Diplodia corticola]
MPSDYLNFPNKVVIAGRTKSNLASTTEKIGAAACYVLGTSATSTLSSLTQMITTEHPEADCLVNNAGVQRPLQVLTHDAADFVEPHRAVINVSSVLGFVPISIINPPSINLRTQLRDGKIKVVGIAPPKVATALHRERDDPDDTKKNKDPNALSVEQSMEEVAWKPERGTRRSGWDRS